MKRFLPTVFFIAVILLMSCDEVLIEENRRIEVEGKLHFPENEPVPRIGIFSVGVFDRNMSSNMDKILGQGRSGSDGNFRFISLDTYSHDLMFAVNPLEFGENEPYASMYFYDPSGDHSTRYDLGSLELPKKVDFSLYIAHASQSEDTLRYSLDYKKPVLRFVYDDGNFIEDSPGSGNFISLREHYPDNEPVTYNFTTLDGSDLKFSYSLGEGRVQEITIPVSTENNIYNFEY